MRGGFFCLFQFKYLLRKMLFYPGKGERVSNTLDLSGDLFVWLISKVYGKENTISS